MNPQRQLATDPHRAAGEAIERVGHPAVGGVFDRRHAERAIAVFDFLEHRAIVPPARVRPMPEPVDRRQVAET